MDDYKIKNSLIFNGNYLTLIKSSLFNNSLFFWSSNLFDHSGDSRVSFHTVTAFNSSDSEVISGDFADVNKNDFAVSSYDSSC